MIVLTVNSGSSSVRLSLFRLDGEAELLHEARASLAGDEDRTALLRRFLDDAGSPRVDAVIHRIVHGGRRFREAVRLDREAEAAIDALSDLAPLHNPTALAWVRASRDVLGDRSLHVGAFDTAFFADLPDDASTYALPHRLARDEGIRRYGFHGLAHRSLWRHWCALRPDLDRGGRIVTFQLGSGCSAAAIDRGRPRDTSMGFSPLEGLVMSSRSGDVDSGLLLHLQRTGNIDPETMSRLLNEESGLVGLSGSTGNLGKLLVSDDPRAALAVSVWVHRARRYLGAFLAVLGGADAILFGGGVGENVPEARRRILAGQEWAGIVLDETANAAVVGREGRFTSDRSPVAAWILPVDEAREMIEEARGVLHAD